jgi:hypothetical protein
MKKVLILAVAIVMCASIASAQSGGNIGLYSDDPGWSDCFLQEALYVNNYIYVVHNLLPEANTSQFMVEHNWTAILGATDYVGNLNLGDPYTGVTITYVGCKPLPYLLCKLAFIPVAPTPPCTVQFDVVADPALASGQIEVVDCASAVLFATGGSLIVNGNINDCPCEVATEETNWSKIKALYQ